MKELSIEEKARRYDEAIDRARKWYNAPNIDKIPTFGNRVIEEIFPELKESEDEKIRKELIAIFKGQIPYTSKEDAKRYIAWLEKQGVQKPQRMISAEAKEAIYDKPAWSEEDENIRKAIIEGLKSMQGSFHYISSVKLDVAINWLKSLKGRYTWKPNEEQIEILDMVLTNESMDDNIARILRELREQLKKLKE